MQKRQPGGVALFAKGRASLFTHCIIEFGKIALD
jgi:hypothetical protein